MNFSQIKDIKIPNDYTKYLHQCRNDGTPIRCLWKKPLTQPATLITLTTTTPYTSGYKWIEIIIRDFLMDKYGITTSVYKSGSTFSATDGSPVQYTTTLPYIHLGYEKGNWQNGLDTTKPVVKINNNPNYVEDLDLEFTIYQTNIDNLPDFENYPYTKNGTLSDATWTFSDVTSRQIHLFASADGDESGFNSQSMAFQDNRKNLCGDYIGRTSEIDTEVVVDAGDPLIKLQNTRGGKVKVASIRTNFDDYKTKYDIATAGKFPKSKYPYLVGYVELFISSTSWSMTKQPSWGIYFSVTR